MAPTIHHLNCGSFCPHGRRLINGDGGWLEPAGLCCHCLLIEGRDGLVLVDTGLGTADLREPARRLGRGFLALARPRLRPEETALHQLQALGYSPRDLRHIVVTHLDLDHAGGLADFPDAEVHVFAAEHRAAMRRQTPYERVRYRPLQFHHGVRWQLHEEEGESWFGLRGLRALPGSGDDILLIPLAGHTRGHCGVAVKRGRGWLLHCGDAYFFREEVNPIQAWCPPGLELFQAFGQFDGEQRRANQERLQQLARDHGRDIELVCAHDPVELARCRERAATPPPSRRSRAPAASAA